MASSDQAPHDQDTLPQPVPEAWLARHGGWLLVLVGMLLIGLAAVSSDAVVASIFALGGIALVVVGVVLPRMHGLFELGAHGFKISLIALTESTDATISGISRLKAHVTETLNMMGQATDGTFDQVEKELRGLEERIAKLEAGRDGTDDPERDL